MSDPNDPSAEGLAAMSIASALLVLLFKKGLISPDEEIAVLDQAQLDLVQKFPHHPGQQKAHAILESVVKALIGQRPAGK